MKKRTLALCYGTRPQVVKASVLLEALRQDWDVFAVDTGQHYDWELNGLHYEQLGVRPPDRFLEVGSSDHAIQTAGILTRVASAFGEIGPEVVVVIGDTNSTLGCALAATKMRIPAVHVEAGLRSRDLMMPEEINRRVVDEISTLLCAPSQAAADFLKRRASDSQDVVFSGDVARDVLRRALSRPDFPEAPWGPHGIRPPYLLLTIHRAELTGKPDQLAAIMKGVGKVGAPVFFPAHPRTRRVLESEEVVSSIPPNVHLHPPVGYLEMISWARSANTILTDSGGLQREAYWLGVPCITLRSETEWLETVEEGANLILPPPSAGDLPDVLASHPGRDRSWQGEAYGTGEAGPITADTIRTRFT